MTNPGFYTFVAPATGVYDIIAAGARGGNILNPDTLTVAAIGGLGSQVEDLFILAAGDTLTILVGGVGGDASLSTFGSGSGGGGGTFVIAAGTVPLLIAGGGFGVGSSAVGGGTGALPLALRRSPFGTTSTGLATSGGAGGPGGAADNSTTDDGSGGGGGGGLLTNGADGMADAYGDPVGGGGLSFVNGGLGGSASGAAGSGGVGGGGGAGGGGGGGGGYSGGAGGNGTGNGQAGTLFDAKLDPIFTVNTAGAGFVTITAVPSAPIETPEPSSLAILGAGLLSLFALTRRGSPRPTRRAAPPSPG